MSQTKATAKTKSKRAGLQFPVSRVSKFLHKGNFAPRVGSGAAVYLTAAAEYLAAEILELSAEVATRHKKSRIIPRYILLAIRNDDELNRLMRGAIISQSGVVPAIHPNLVPKKTAKSEE